MQNPAGPPKGSRCLLISKSPTRGLVMWHVIVVADFGGSARRYSSAFHVLDRLPMRHAVLLHLSLTFRDVLSSSLNLVMARNNRAVVTCGCDDGRHRSGEMYTQTPCFHVRKCHKDVFMSEFLRRTFSDVRMSQKDVLPMSEVHLKLRSNMVVLQPMTSLDGHGGVM
jgi:hypothetical protein